ncbi:MAG: hypothetical protein KGJ57_19505 [Sphingomonadales bacterium]|nr:hypothetical protein [Sphingomonadales bacterium]MDE2171581.1 hypothetical protein [Sphingomonadales bacterium]
MGLIHRLISHVVLGISFRGAGAITQEGMQLSGLNNAVTVWAPAVDSFGGVRKRLDAKLRPFFVPAGSTAAQEWIKGR